MDKQKTGNEAVKEIMSIKLNNEEFGYIIELLYNSDEAKAPHNTAIWDKFIRGRLSKKLEEMIDCDLHRPCKVMSSLMVGKRDAEEEIEKS